MSPGVLPQVEVPETPAADNGVAPAHGAADAFLALPSHLKLGVVLTPVSWARVVTVVAANANTSTSAFIKEGGARSSQLPRAGKGKSASPFAHATITARNVTTCAFYFKFSLLIPFLLHYYHVTFCHVTPHMTHSIRLPIT